MLFSVKNIYFHDSSINIHSSSSCFSTSNTVVTVGFQLNAYTAAEAFEVVNICATLTGQTQRDVLVNISTSNSTGTAEGQQV